jgi:hypothetical protein
MVVGQPEEKIKIAEEKLLCLGRRNHLHVSLQPLRCFEPLVRELKEWLSQLVKNVVLKVLPENLPQ